MDVLGVSHNQVMKSKRQSRRDKKEIKVTYISSPMKVKTCASNFRALVQELTGQDSNVAEAFLQEADAVEQEDVHHKGSTQQWRVGDVDQGYIPLQASWLKPVHGNQLHSSSLLEPLKQHRQYDLLSFDML